MIPTSVVSRGALAAAFLMSASFSSWAVLPFVLSTNSSSVLSTGNTWTGSGTLQPNVIPISFSSNGLRNLVLVSGFSSGSLTIGPDNLLPKPRIAAATGVRQTVTLTGGTADLYVANSGSFDGGDELFNSVGISGFSAGVTKIIWTLDFTLPIAGRDDNALGLNNRPMGGALGLVVAGTGLAPSQYSVKMTLGGVSSAPTTNGTFTPGVPANARPLVSAGWAGTSITQAGATTFTTDAGFDGIIPLGNSSPDFLLIRGYDYDGSGNNYLPADAPLVYAASLTFEISLTSGLSFAADTAFTMSMDGQQFSNVNNAIPEPTAGVLVGLAVLGGLIGWRRRRIF